MAITIATDKIAIQSVLQTDPYLKEYLGFQSSEYYKVRATDEILGLTDNKNQLKQQIFIYNITPEDTINPLIKGIIYEIDVSVPYAKSGTADLAIEQIMALLDGLEIANVHELELLDPPMVLSSDTALYQIGVRFICYVSKITQKNFYVKEERMNKNGR